MSADPPVGTQLALLTAAQLALLTAVESLTEALDEMHVFYVEALDGHLSTLDMLYRLVTACLDDHEAGRDEVAWSALRRGMEKAKTLELELLARKTELVEPP